MMKLCVLLAFTLPATIFAALGDFTVLDKACDEDKDGYLVNSPGVVDTLSACVEMCELSGQCVSASFYPNKLCNHFATNCANLADVKDAVTVKPATNFMWTLVDYGSECDGPTLATSSKQGSLTDCLNSCEAESKCQSFTYLPDNTCKHFGGQCEKTKTSGKGISMVHLTQSTTCDTAQGEIFLKASSSYVADMATCHKSCMDTPACQSVTYFFADEYCSHFATACTKRKFAADAVSERLKIFTTTTTTTNPCLSGNGGCDNKRTCTFNTAGMKCGDCPAGYVNDGAKNCKDVDECQTNNGGCDGKRTCTNTMGGMACGDCSSGYANVGAKGCKPVLTFNNQVCDVSQMEIWLGETKNVADLKACKKLCQDTKGCVSIAYYDQGGCSQFSTCCEKTTAGQNVHSVRVNPCPTTNHKVCDVSNGEVFDSTSKQPDLAACKKSCEDSSKCISITYYSHGGCDHFSTCCKKMVHSPNADAIRVNPCPTTVDPNSLPNNRECDVSQGEVYIGKSSGKQADRAACKKSCMDEPTCQSITYYVDGWCSHFSTRCEKTRTVKDAYATRLKDFTTAAPINNNYNGKECDTSQGENLLVQTSVHSADLVACKKTCDSDDHCQSITFYADGWCSHFSTSCDKQRDVPNAHAERTKNFKTTPKPAGKHEECDASQGEIYLHGSSGIAADYATCVKDCNDELECQSITFYAHGWCSHFSTHCTKRKPMENAVAKNLKQDLFTNSQCDETNGELYLAGSSKAHLTHAACYQSCVATTGCRAVTYFRSGWCSHFASCCEKRKPSADADAQQMKLCNINKQECDTTQGEIYIGGNAGTTQEECKKSCIDDANCLSITHYLDGWCSRFSTPCDKRKTVPNAHAVALKSGTTTAPHNNKVCDVGNGEVFESTRNLPTLEACKKSCQDSSKCISITYYSHGGCDHFSTCCTKTKHSLDADAMRVNSCPTTNDKVCDVNNGEVFDSASKQPDLAACKKSCKDSAKCKAITYYSHGGCDHFSSCCDKMAHSPGSNAVIVKGCTPINHKVCDVTNGEKFDSNSKQNDLAACKKSCEDSASCLGITYYKHGGCDHFKTCCKATTPSADAHAMQIKSCTTPPPTTTTAPPPTTTTTPQPNCVFCQRRPPLAFMIDKSGSMGAKMGGKGPATRFVTVVNEVIRMLASMPDGTQFSLQMFSAGVYPYHSAAFRTNSAAERTALRSWMIRKGPGGYTGMLKAIKALLTKKNVAETLYFLADGEISVQSDKPKVYAEAKNAGKPIHIVGVDLKASSGGYKTISTIADNSGGTKFFL